MFNHGSKALLFSAVGRLISNSLIIAVGKGRNKIFKTTQRGDNEIKTNLLLTKHLLNDIQFDYYLISISNSETYKSERDRIRSYLKNKGFALINNGLLINGLIDINKFKSKFELINRHSNITYFKIYESPSELHKEIKNHKLLNKYKLWIKSTNEFIKNIPRDIDQKRLASKILIYNLSLIIGSHCLLNQPRNIGEIKKLYNKIRNYCYI